MVNRRITYTKKGYRILSGECRLSLSTKMIFSVFACWMAFGPSGPLMAQQEGAFEAADRNRNQKISKRELGKYLKEKLPEFTHVKELMAALDADSDGNLSRSEFAKRMEQIKELQHKLMSEPAAGGAESAEKSKPMIEFADKYNRDFAEKEPRVGEAIPAVSAFDEQGQPLDLEQLKGQYAVLVFGCLT